MGVLACTAHSIFIFFKYPAKLVEWDRRPDERFQRWLNGAYAFAVFLGIGIALYAAVTSFLWWMPRSWTRINDDGEREWMGHGIAMMVAFFGSIWFVTGASRIAAELAHKSRQIKLLQEEGTRRRQP
jgi:hypothetical protein